MKLIITEHQVEKFAERMGYIDKVIKAQMREGDWEHLAWLIERYGDPYGDEPMFDWRKCED